MEAFYCNFGLNPEYQQQLEKHGLEITGTDQNNEARIAECLSHPFFVGTLFVPARPIAIEGSLDLIGRGYHREAMFWVGVTHSRCQKVLSRDAPGDLTRSFKDSYQELVGDLGVSTFAEVRRRCAEIEEILPRVCDLAEGLIAANCEIDV